MVCEVTRHDEAAPVARICPPLESSHGSTAQFDVEQAALPDEQVQGCRFLFRIFQAGALYSCR